MISDGMAGVLRSLRLGVAEHLARDAVGVLDAAGLTVSLLVGDDRAAEPLWCHPAFGARVEELQFTLGEGPGPDVLRLGAPVVEPDLSAVRAERWPAFLPAARALELGGIYCLPLGIGAIRLGVLTVLCRGPHGLTPQQYEDAAALASALTSAFLNGARGPSPNGGGHDAATATLVGQPRELSRAVVHQATGMISVQLGVPLAEALVRLRAYAYASERPLGAVAEDVVARRLRFRDDMDGPHPTDGGKR
ncbi:ANTAR domain-containing protein [Streptomyces sp. NPDC002564]|uniref:ANTAR domain-containing protein n=1 Tax=Streptomyces sp. NPDC002564 TaxID=3364649 RepID=UPI0036CBB706